MGGKNESDVCSGVAERHRGVHVNAKHTRFFLYERHGRGPDWCAKGEAFVLMLTL